MKNEVNKEYTINLATMTSTTMPFLYQVNLMNDDFTPMEFVIGILEKFFLMNRKRATTIMMEAHMKGKASCGVFTKDVAESKVSEVLDYARVHEHPLMCSLEAVT